MLFCQVSVADVAFLIAVVGVFVTRPNAFNFGGGVSVHGSLFVCLVLREVALAWFNYRTLITGVNIYLLVPRNIFGVVGKRPEHSTAGNMSQAMPGC